MKTAPTSLIMPAHRRNSIPRLFLRKHYRGRPYPITVLNAGAIRLPTVLSERGRPAVCVSFQMHSCPVNHTVAALCDKLKYDFTE